MFKIIVDIVGRIVSNLYTDSPDAFQVEITDDNDDLKERERMEQKINYQLDHESLREILNKNADTEEEAEAIETPYLDPNAFMLIQDSERVKTETGQLLQKLDVAFTDGFLSSNGMLSRYISSLYKSGNPAAHTVYQELKPLIQKMDSAYNSMSLRLNQEDYDHMGIDDESDKY